MGQPDIEGQSVPDEESLAFEALAVWFVLGGVESLVSAALGSILATYLGATESVGALSAEAGSALGRATAARLRALRWEPMAPRLVEASRRALVLGFERAETAAGSPADPINFTEKARDRSSSIDPDAALRAKLRQAARLAERIPLDTKTNVLAVAGRARSGVSDAKGMARWVANDGINAGTAEVARQHGRRLIWITERHACLHCLAHAGWVIDPGKRFPPGLTFDPTGSNLLGVPWPPLHPNCRCQIRAFDGPAGPPDRNRSKLDPAARLAAEARRTVLYQWSDYASGRAAERAARALLRAGTDLPASVERRAAQALRAGRRVSR